MCLSRFHKVLRASGPGTVEVEDMDGAVHEASLLTLEGPEPAPGEWLVVHSGYVIDRADAVQVEDVAAELARARPPRLHGETGEDRS